MAKVKVRTLTALLLKEGITSPDGCLTKPSEFTALDLASGLPFTGRIFIHNPPGKPPKWFDFLAVGAPSPLEPFFNSSNSAVLFVNAGDRMVAFTFGYARSSIRPEVYERDFGIKVALNEVDPAALRSVDVDSFQELTIHTRRQTSRGSGVGAFDLDISQVLRGVTGKPREPNFARRITGSDSLTFTLPIEFNQLGAKCAELTAAYERDDYKDNFPWFDHLRAVRAPAMLEVLDEKLLEAIRAKEAERVYLAPPEVLDWQAVDRFSYSTDEADALYDDLDLGVYIDSLDDLDALTVDDLRKAHKVEAHLADTGSVVNTWPVFDCAVFETEYDGSYYALTGGRWFLVSKDLVQEVNEYAEEKAALALTLPPYLTTYKDEAAYNAAVSENDAAMANIDRAPVLYGGGQSKVEVCDLFSKDRQFIHVKRLSRSATLSHLFAQGSVSGQAFLESGPYREKFRTLLTNKNYKAHLVLVPSARPNSADYEIAYAIVAPDSKNWPASLPFFSKLHFRQTATRIELMNYKVSLSRISIEAG